MMEFLQRNVVQTIIGVAMVGLIIYLSVTGREAGAELWAIIATIIGFYFGVEAKAAEVRAREHRDEQS